MEASRDQWRSELEKLYRKLKLAEAFLREAEMEHRQEQAERSRAQIEFLRNAISDQRCRPFLV